MVRKLLILLPILALNSCISLGLGSGQPQKTTIVVPQGATVTCANQDGTPCQPQ